MSWDESKRKSARDSKGRRFSVYDGRRTTDLETRILRRVTKKDGKKLDMWTEWGNEAGTSYMVTGAGDVLLLVVQHTGADKEP